MRKALTGTLAALTVLFAAGEAGAQGVIPLSFEVRAGAAIPTGDFADDGDAETGFALGGTVEYSIIPTFGVYGGFSRDAFGCGDDCDYVSSGFDVGGVVRLSRMVPLQPWVKAGITFHELEAESSTGGVSASLTSDRAVGIEVGGGLSFDLAPSIQLTPGVWFHSYTPDFDGEEGVDVTYIVADLGLRLSL